LKYGQNFLFGDSDGEPKRGGKTPFPFIEQSFKRGDQGEEGSRAQSYWIDKTVKKKK